MQEWACVQRSDGVVHTSGREACAQLTAKTLTQRTNLIFGPIETHAFLQASGWWDVAKYLYHRHYGAEYSGADQGLWMQSVTKDALDEYGLQTWEFQHTSYCRLAEHKRAIAVDQKLSCFLLTPTFLKNNCNQVKEEFLERYRSQVKGVEKGPLPCWAFEAGGHLSPCPVFSSASWNESLRLFLYFLSATPRWPDHLSSPELRSQLPKEEASPLSPLTGPTQESLRARQCTCSAWLG